MARPLCALAVLLTACSLELAIPDVGPSPAAEAGEDLATADVRPPGDVGPVDRRIVDLVREDAEPDITACPPSCGPHASCNLKTGQCVCEQGYVDNDSEPGCEAVDSQCKWDQCDRCPLGWCGPHTQCLTTNLKCRCASGDWKDANGDITEGPGGDGCETPTSGCSPTNCNACPLAFCGGHADCMQNKCACLGGWKLCPSDGFDLDEGCLCEK